MRDPDLHGARIPFEALPIVDLEPLLADGRGKAAVIDALGWAARHTGFFYLRNHGISQTLIDEVRAMSREFFELPREEKMRWHYTKGRNHSGYLAIDQEITDADSGGDYKEGLDYLFEIPSHDPDSDFPFYGAPNLWISQPAGYREALQRYFDRMLDLNSRLLDAMLQSLGVAPGAVSSLLSKPIAVLSPRRYPPQHGHITRAHLGANAHEDWCCCTVLAQDTVPGLQAQNSEGQWIEVPPLDGTLVCNLGELLQFWTNGRFVATRHRVINDSGRDRYSLPFFLSPNRRSEVRVLDQCCTPHDPPRYPPVVVGDYFTGRHQYVEST